LGSTPIYYIPISSCLFFFRFSSTSGDYPLRPEFRMFSTNPSFSSPPQFSPLFSSVYVSPALPPIRHGPFHPSLQRTLTKTFGLLPLASLWRHGSEPFFMSPPFLLVGNTSSISDPYMMNLSPPFYLYEFWIVTLFSFPSLVPLVFSKS